VLQGGLDALGALMIDFLTILMVWRYLGTYVMLVVGVDSGVEGRRN
jgi:hypothetical protein